MNSLSIIPVTMLSTEIAELTGKQVKHVNRDIEKMMIELEIDGSTFGRIYKDSMNRDKKCYALDKRLTNILITGYSIKLRAAVIDRLAELESGVVALPQTFSEALRALADKSDEVDRLASETQLLEVKNTGLSKTVSELKPAAEYGKAVMGADTLYTATNIGSEIGISAVALNNILRNRLNVIRRGTGETDYELCSRYANNGFVRYKTTTYQNSEGINKSTRSLRWTRKGFDWLTAQKCFIVDSDRKSLPVDMPLKAGI